LGTRVANDALVMVDRAYRVVRVVTVASHTEFADCMENWVHSLGAMRTLSADGESANHSANARELRQHYGISFERRNAPYHLHHNGPVETMVHLLKRLIVDMCRIAGLSVAAHWPLAIAQSADIANVMPRVSLHGRSARATLDGSPPSLRHFRTFAAWSFSFAARPSSGTTPSTTLRRSCLFSLTSPRCQTSCARCSTARTRSAPTTLLSRRSWRAWTTR
jgi:hypothetical protein